MARTQRTVELDVPKLRAFMERRGVTAAQISEEMGLCRQYISNVFRTSHKISLTANKALCAVFEVPEDTFTKQHTPDVFKEELEGVPDSEIIERLHRIEKKLDKILELWG